MDDEEAINFYEKVISGRQHRAREITLTHRDGDTLTCEIQPVERKRLLDQIQRLPDELLDIIAEADDAGEAEEEVEPSRMIRGMSAEAIEAFEEICAMGLFHEALHEDDFRDMCHEFSFETLFPVGAQVIEVSLEDTGVVQDFQIPD